MSPSVSIAQGWIYSAMMGTMTKKPHMPKMMDGTAASSSIAVPTGLRIHCGAISVRKKAIPKASGTERISANTDVTSVP